MSIIDGDTCVFVLLASDEQLCDSRAGVARQGTGRGSVHCKAPATQELRSQ